MTRLKFPRRSKYVPSDLQVVLFIYLQTRLKSSFYPSWSQKACWNLGNPEAAIEECAANSDAVSLRVCIAWVVTFANIDLVATSIAVHLKSIQPLYDRNAKPATNNPDNYRCYFHDFFDSISSYCPEQESPPADKKSSTGKSESA
jgi:hypothetical protein